MVRKLGCKIMSGRRATRSMLYMVGGRKQARRSQCRVRRAADVDHEVVVHEVRVEALREHLLEKVLSDFVDGARRRLGLLVAREGQPPAHDPDHVGGPAVPVGERVRCLNASAHSTTERRAGMGADEKGTRTDGEEKGARTGSSLSLSLNPRPLQRRDPRPHRRRLHPRSIAAHRRGVLYLLRRAALLDERVECGANVQLENRVGRRELLQQPLRLLRQCHRSRHFKRRRAQREREREEVDLAGSLSTHLQTSKRRRARGRSS